MPLTGRVRVPRAFRGTPLHSDRRHTPPERAPRGRGQQPDHPTRALVAWTQIELDRAVSYLAPVLDPLLDRVAEMEAHEDP